MNSKKLSYSEKKRFLLFAISFIFLFSLISYTSATTGEWNLQIGEPIVQDAGYGDFAVQMSTNTQLSIDLNQYCDNCGYYWIIYRNPDNLVQTVGLKSQNNNISDNSLFKVQITDKGILKFTSKSKVGDSDIDPLISVYSSDDPNKIKSINLFYLQVRKSYLPIYTGVSDNSFQLTGFDSIQSSMPFNQLDISTMPTSYKIYMYIGGSLNTTLTTSNVTDPNGLCKNSFVYVCLTGIGTSGINPVNWEITGLNLSSSGYIVFSAINKYGEVKSPQIPINTISKNTTVNTPFRTNFNMPNINLGFNESTLITTDNLWKNSSYLVINFTYPNNSTQVILNSSPILREGSKYIRTGYFYIALFRNAISLDSSNLNISFPISVTGCNDQGCDSTNNIMNVNILGKVPVVLQTEPINLVLEYHQYKAIDLTKLFSKADYYIIDFNDGLHGGNDTFIITSFYNNLYSFNSANYPLTFVGGSSMSYYQVTLGARDVIYFESADKNLNFVMTTTACNSEGCSQGAPINFYIQGAKEPEIVSQIGNNPSGNWWSSISTTFMGLFPPSDNLTNSTKVGIVIISMFLVSALILFMLNKADVEPSTLVVSILVVNTILFAFFVIKGYISSTIPIVVGLLAIIVIFFKIKGGGS